MGGYMGKMAWIDLSTLRTAEQEIPEEIRKQSIGGAGLAAWILASLPFGKIDPLGPDNVLVFATGPLTGANVPTSGLYAAAAKSP